MQKQRNSVEQQQPQFTTRTANVKQGNFSSIPNLSTGRALASAGKCNVVEHSDSVGPLHRYRTEPRVKEGKNLHVHGEENLKCHKRSSVCDNVKTRCTEKKLDLTEKKGVQMK